MQGKKGPGAAPCSGCRTAQRECKSTHAGSKTKDVKHRVLISHQYERKIDQFEGRLAGIESLLQGLSATLSSRVSDAGGSHPGSVASGRGMRTYTSPSGLSDANTAYDEQTASVPGPRQGSKPAQQEAGQVGGESLFDSVSAFEGTSSLTAQTVFASDFVELVVSGNTPRLKESSAKTGPQSDMQRAMAALRTMAQGGSSRSSRPPPRQFPRQKPVPRGGVSQLPMPPMDVVIQLLREIRVSPPMAFMMSCAVLDIDEFIAACRDVYFATEDFALSRFIVVNGGLFHLFEEKAATHNSEAEREMFAKCQRLCGDNIETALANLPLFLPPSGEMVEALVLGVTYAIESSKFTLAWQLNSAAATMCQALGWHRVSPAVTQNGTTQTSIGELQERLRPSAFWFCYMIDKGLALRFGRPSVLPDWDISTPRDFFYGKDKIPSTGPSTSHIQGPEALNRVFNTWIRSGSILGQTYEQLYSPSALARSPQERAATARQLGATAKQVWSEFEQLAPSPDIQSGMSGLGAGHSDGDSASDWRRTTLKRVLLSGQVGHLSMLTLIYRAIPREQLNTTIHPECIAAARGAFQSHQICMSLPYDNLMEQAGYLNWTVLYAPFTPLIVMFCHVIEMASHCHQAEGSLAEDEITTDLAHLEAFAASLQPLVSLSQAIARMHSLSRLLHQLATLYVQAKRTEEAVEDETPTTAANTNHETQMHIDSAGMQTVGTDLDLYLSQLGFLPDPSSMAQLGAVDSQAQLTGLPHGGQMGTIETSNGGLEESMATVDGSTVPPRLEDWFSGNTYVMGLVEDELFDFVWDPLTGNSV
ncbi:hypothetical protein Sste5344_000756 [Sporothrix stenoceras]